MNIFLLILAGILLIIDILIFCPLSIKLVYDKGVKLRVGYLFPVFRVLPQKPKKEKPEKKKKNKKQKKKQPETEEKKKNPVGDIIQEHGLRGLLELLRELARIAVEAGKKITGHTVISKMDLQLLVATDNAAETAVTYGAACAAVFPLVSIIEQHVKKCCHHERIAPCFTETENKVYFEMRIRIIPFFLLSAGVKALLKTLRTLAKFR